MIDPRRPSRRRPPVLIASGVVAAVAITWGGLVAVGTLTPSGVPSSSDTRSVAPSPAPDATGPAGATGSTGGTGITGVTDLTDPTDPTDPTDVPDPARTPSDASADSPPELTTALEEPRQHGDHVLDVGTDAADIGSGRVGTPLSDEEPSIIAASGQQPGAQQEVSLGSAAAQSMADTPTAGTPTAGGAVDRTAGLTPRAPIDPAEVTNGLAALGGCLAEYGTNGQCLPVVPPSMAEHAQQMVDSGIGLDSMPHPWSCTEVRQLFAEGLSVRQAGVDPQELDVDGDGTACGAGD